MKHNLYLWLDEKSYKFNLSHYNNLMLKINFLLKLYKFKKKSLKNHELVTREKTTFLYSINR